jgi:hypothetical protein
MYGPQTTDEMSELWLQVLARNPAGDRHLVGSGLTYADLSLFHVVAGLRAIAAQYPTEVEARTYLALHLMRGFSTPDRQPREGSMEAADLLRTLVVEAPDHPGVHHYIIHGFEGSPFAKKVGVKTRSSGR